VNPQNLRKVNIGRYITLTHPERTLLLAPASTTSLDNRKRKRHDEEEDSSTSKLAETAAEEPSQGQPLAFNPFDAAIGMSS
jgi:guanylate kinase